MKLKIVALVMLAAMVVSCGPKKRTKNVDFINPMIGTGGHGHTYPGATVPFGMVQLSPDTRKDSWDGCSGYHHSDSIIYGFSHTHLSGTGVGDYGDIRLMPMVGELRTEPGYGQYPEGYGSLFNRDREKAEAGFYAVFLKDHEVYAGLTATERVGFHKYMFPKTDEAHILIDLKESVTSEEIVEASIEVISETEVSGLRRTKGWANDQYVYFYAEFSTPFEAFGFVKDGEVLSGDGTEVSSIEGDNIKAWFDFETDFGEIVFVKVGISPVDVEGAKNNLKTEVPDWDFEKTKREAKKKWARQLDKISIETNDETAKEIFYTALYHTMLAPNLYVDVDGRYRGHDLQIHHAKDFDMYTIFSLWDTFRTLHPLFNIIERKRTADFINSMLDMYKDDGLLPVWELAACETNCMIGYHSVPVIADAYKKGIRGFDEKMALEAMQITSNANQFGLDWYRKKGYIPADKDGSSISKTLEYAYDDWCIAEMAMMLENQGVYEQYTQRAQYYKNIYDAETGFFRGKSNGSFVEPFDPTEVNFMLTEANTWQYNFFVPQDINTHIEMMGGTEKYEAKLDELFTSSEGLAGRHQSDITGLIGQYAHGNEPSHHMAYLYNYMGKPWKTQQLVSQIMSELYTNQPDGLSGNEDCGQMSAWYVMSALGFYPVTPGSDMYVLGTPRFSSMTVNLENGNSFVVKARNLSDDAPYVQSVSYNGNPWTKSYITHEMIMNGGMLEFEMGKQPNKSFGNEIVNRPVQKITDHLITPVPYFEAESKTFEKPMLVGLGNIYPEASIRWGYQTEEDEPALKAYKKPLKVKNSISFVAVANANGKNSFMEEAEYVKIPPGRTVTVKSPYSSQYTAGGDKALINTLRGGENFTTGNWQGYWGVDLEATIDMGKAEKISKIGVGMLQDQNSWIFMPEWVKVEISKDGKTFTEVGKVANDIEESADGGIVKDFEVDFDPQRVKYIRVHAKNIGKCPSWHKGYPNPAWIFVDEVWWE